MKNKWPICNFCKYWEIKNTKNDPWGLNYAICAKQKNWTSEITSCEEYKEVT